MSLELPFCQYYLKNTRASLQCKLAKQNLTNVMKKRKASCSLDIFTNWKQLTTLTLFILFLYCSPAYLNSANKNSIRLKLKSTSTLTPSSYQVTQFLIAGIESFQFFTDDVIENPSINQCLPKFSNLGSIISWVTQDRFQGLIRKSFKGQDTEYYCIFRAGNLVAYTSLTLQMSWECSKSKN